MAGNFPPNMHTTTKPIIEPEKEASVDVEIEELPEDYEEQEDGSVLFLEDEIERADAPEFYSNLADVLEESELDDLATKYLKLLEGDKESRKKRDELYEEGLRRTGLGNDSPGGAEFQGASKVNHPILAEACIDFSSRAIKELVPADGPVKTKIPGKATPEKLEKAERKRKTMNWQLMEEMEEYYSEKEQCLTQLPMGGSQYIKFWYDTTKKRRCCEFIPIDDVLLPFAASNFYTSPRVSIRLHLTRQAIEERIEAGIYRDIGLTDPSDIEETLAEQANNKIEGRQLEENEDGIRTDFEIYTWDRLSIDGDKSLPYIITIDETTTKVLSIYRNWEQEDPECKKMDHIVEYTFLPWRGAYGIGLPHLIGGITGALTGGLRALLDSAHINNMPTAISLPGMRIGGQSQQINVTQVNEVKASKGIQLQDDIRKMAMPVPFSGPSPVLFQLLGFLESAARGVVKTSLDETAESNDNVPVGTQLSRVEQGLVVFSSIHARLHKSQKKELEILHRINKFYYDEDKAQAVLGEDAAKLSDFEGPMDVVPVSDSRIFSEQQRWAQIQMLQQMSAANPGLYNNYEINKRALKVANIDDYESILIEPPEPKLENPLAENVKLYMGQPVIAFMEQNHAAHIKLHYDFLKSPLFSSDPFRGLTFKKAATDHIMQHISLWYAQMIMRISQDNLPFNLEDLAPEDEDEQNALAEFMAQVSGVLLTELTGSLGQLPAELLRMMTEVQKQVSEQQAQQMQMPTDPNKAADNQVRMAAIQQKQQESAMKAQERQVTEQQRQGLEQSKLLLGEKKLSLEEQQMAQEAALKEADIMARQQMNREDNQTAKDLALLEVTTGENIAVSTGTGINP